MRLSACLIAADPAWIEASVLSYYNAVDRIFVSYDVDGDPIEVETALRRLRVIDAERKLVLVPGKYGRSAETFQRQAVLDEASVGVDWVLQIDTNEVIGDLLTFLGALTEANRRGFGGLEYPARNFYRQIGGTNFLECCRPGWRVAAGYSGPVAVRARSTLLSGRHCDTSLYRVDFSHRNTDPAQPRQAPVHRVIAQVEGIYHYAPTGCGGTEDRAARDWERCGRHPYLSVAAGPVRQFVVRGAPKWLRISKGHASPAWAPQLSGQDR